jgi:hypothetical protein
MELYTMKRWGEVESVEGDGRSVEREAEWRHHARYQETVEWKLKTEERKRKAGFRCRGMTWRGNCSICGYAACLENWFKDCKWVSSI